MDKKAYEVALRMMAPPRDVPLSCRLVLMLNVGVQIGAFLLAFSTPFFWLFVGNSELSSITFRGETMRTNGVVMEVRDTQASEGGATIYEVRYRYSVSATPYEGASYERGETEREAGDLVIVEYLKRDPSRSRIEGLRRGMFGPGVLFVLIFPAIGLAVTLVALGFGARRSRLLVRGVAVFGSFKETRPTNTTINGRRLFEVIHEYRTLDGKLHESSTKTTDVDSVTDDDQELLLYDPSRPSRAVAVDGIKPLPKLDEGGGFRGNVVSAAFRLILPAIVVAGNLLWLASRL